MPCPRRRRSTSAGTFARPRSCRSCGVPPTSPARGARCCRSARWCSSGCCRRCDRGEVQFSGLGIREGLVYGLLSETEHRGPAAFVLRRLCAHALALAGARSRACTWTDALSSRPGPTETEEERRFRYAACLLSDVGSRAHPDYRGEQSLVLIARSALGGIDHPGRGFLALAIYFRHVGAGRESDDEQADFPTGRLKEIVPKKLYRRARIIGAAIRAAHMLSIGRPGIIDETPVAYDEGKLVLTLPKSHAALDGERVRRRFGVLAQLLERDLEFASADCPQFAPLPWRRAP